MNCSIKTRTFNFLTTPTQVNPGQLLSSCLEPGARILGIVCSVNVATDSASAAIYASVGGIDVPLMNMNASFGTAPFAATAGSIQWWAGCDHQYTDNKIQTSAPATNTVQGNIPKGMPETWQDKASGAIYNLKLQLLTNNTSSIIVFYTVDPPTDTGIVM